jgi:hypothetical protein
LVLAVSRYGGNINQLTRWLNTSNGRLINFST